MKTLNRHDAENAKLEKMKLTTDNLRIV